MSIAGQPCDDLALATRKLNPDVYRVTIWLGLAGDKRGHTPLIQSPAPGARG